MGGGLNQFTDNNDTTIAGGTDGTVIGNVSDRLKVDAVFNSTPNVTEAVFPTFSFYSSETAIANNKSMISLVNTTGSTVIIRIREIRLINVQDTTAVTGVIAEFNLYRCTSHSAGTALTATTADTSDSLNVAVTGRTGATIVGEVTVPLKRVQFSTDEWGVGATDVESFDHAFQAHLPFYEVQNKCKPITLRANEGITLKQVINTNVGVFDVQIIFTQETT